MLACVDSAFCCACTDQCVQFVDNQHYVAGTANFIHDLFQALFKFAPVLGSGDEKTDVEHDDFLSRKDVRNVRVDDTDCQTFCDSGFTHTGFTDKHRIVLRTATENLNDALDFFLATDNRIQSVFRRRLSEVETKLVEGRSFRICLLK